MGDDSASRGERLDCIAGILVLSVECFRSGGGLEHLDGAVRCLMLWQQIESAEGRQKAFDALAEIAAAEPSRGKSALTTVGDEAVDPLVLMGL